MPVRIGEQHQHGFDEPLGLLSDCHRRIEHFLSVLITVARQARGGALDAQQQAALDRALTYFRSAAPRHTEDEEQSLFPRMRASDDPRAREAMAAIDALEADHRAADAAHAEVDALGTRWLAEHQLPAQDHQRLVELLEKLQTLYRAHIAVEDANVFPLAGQVLSAEAKAQVGSEMASRRGLGAR